MGWFYENQSRSRATYIEISMSSGKKEFMRFLIDIRNENYNREFASFNSSNLIMQEGIINYDISLNDSIISLILDLLVKLETDSIDQSSFREIIDDLIEVFSGEYDPEIQIQFAFHKKEIKQLYYKYSENLIAIESLRSALGKYCCRKDDFRKLIDMASVS